MSDQINEMFSAIHKRYDLMNHMLSLGIDGIWRKRAAEESIIDKKSYRVLDVASGTGELAITIKKLCDKSGKKIELFGVDFNKDMLGIAKKKAKKLDLDIRFQIGDALALKFPNDYFEVVASSFGLRDFDSLEKFVKESHRVLKKNGKLVLLEMSKPDIGIMKYLFRIYFGVMLLEGLFVDRRAYSFLVDSIKRFDKRNLVNLLKEHGFVRVELVDLPFRAAFLATAYKA